LVISGAIFLILGYIILPYFTDINHASYNRAGIESICAAKFGDTMLEDVLPSELFIVSFEYSNHTPVFFTKYLAQEFGGVYNQSVSNATQASSAAPVYFDPKIINNFVLIDGGVYANDPSLLAFLHATYVLN
jgi:patatin-like phospholipase/acyl hydrolase